jgi:hypothetical protein
VEAFCGRLSVGSERGHRRDDVRSGLRILGFEQRLTIAFTVDDETVTVLRVFTAGKNWETSLYGCITQRVPGADRPRIELRISELNQCDGDRLYLRM